MSNEKCTECGRFAPVPPLCINCMLDMTDEGYENYTRFHRILAVVRDEENGQMLHECKMCGKPCASVDENGHCYQCRQVWNG